MSNLDEELSNSAVELIKQTIEPIEEIFDTLVVVSLVKDEHGHKSYQTYIHGDHVTALAICDLAKNHILNQLTDSDDNLF